MFFKKTKFSVLIIVPVLILSMLCGCGIKEQRQSKTFIDYFDTVITVIGYDSRENFDNTCGVIESQLDKFHKLFDIYHGYDDIVNIYDINNSNGQAVKVSTELAEFLSYCKDMYDITNGETNIAMGSVLSIWHNARSTSTVPDMNDLMSAAEHISIENVLIDEQNNTVQLLDAEMTLDVGAIAKGYALQQIITLLRQSNVTGYAINAGGMVMCLGLRGDGSDWSVGIENPNDTSNILLSVNPENFAVVTSGTYQRYFEKNGIRYHHIIDPQTLMPENNFLSVTVITENCALGDALSTALFNMTVDEGKALVNELNADIEVMWVIPDETTVFTEKFENYAKK